ncbi:MAG: aldose 1-epimerase [Candidatus Glassbacteria bacterium]|nr:aldose 1-epimerase [Candidatus Glassbacteria bacterium]
MQFTKAKLFIRSFPGPAAALLCGVLASGCGEKAPEQPAPPPFSARVETDKTLGRPVVVLARAGALPLEARIAPGAGANLFSLTCQGQDPIYPPDSMAGFDGSRPGIPVLYPSPCRLTSGRFAFDGVSFDFGINRDGNWIHGLVRNEPWEHGPPAADQHGARVLTWIDFRPGSPLYEKFGFDHRLSLLFSIDDQGLRIGYKVENRDSRRLPFGFGVHPYFNYLGPRDQAYVQVPAGEQMELADLIPTGRLEKVEGTATDLRQPTQVAGRAIDNVYFGMTPQQQARIEYRQAGIRISLTASEAFRHLIVWNDPANPFFCVENMTCSPDVFNVYARGFEEESGLQVVPPHGSSEGWIRYLVETME